jgi:hypothetical protein
MYRSKERGRASAREREREMETGRGENTTWSDQLQQQQQQQQQATTTSNNDTIALYKLHRVTTCQRSTRSSDGFGNHCQESFNLGWVIIEQSCLLVAIIVFEYKVMQRDSGNTILMRSIAIECSNGRLYDGTIEHLRLGLGAAMFAKYQWRLGTRKWRHRGRNGIGRR